jgi:hypothetical protein
MFHQHQGDVTIGFGKPGVKPDCFAEVSGRKFKLLRTKEGIAEVILALGYIRVSRYHLAEQVYRPGMVAPAQVRQAKQMPRINMARGYFKNLGA